MNNFIFHEDIMDLFSKAYFIEMSSKQRNLHFQFPICFIYLNVNCHRPNQLIDACGRVVKMFTKLVAL